jgi:hypothetical protein
MTTGMVPCFDSGQGLERKGSKGLRLQIYSSFRLIPQIQNHHKLPDSSRVHHQFSPSPTLKLSLIPLSQPQRCTTRLPWPFWLMPGWPQRRLVDSYLFFVYILLMGLQTLPSGLVLRTEGELSGPSHPVSEMEWTGVVVDGAEPVTLYGTLEVSCLIYPLLPHLLSIVSL